jgi:hypothetical protein
MALNGQVQILKKCLAKVKTVLAVIVKKLIQHE